LIYNILFFIYGFSFDIVFVYAPKVKYRVLLGLRDIILAKGGAEKENF
jgi:hypothetical protein